MLLAWSTTTACTDDYRGVGDLHPREWRAIQDSPSFSYNLSWESLVNDSNFLTAKLTGYDGTDDRLAIHGDVPDRYDARHRLRLGRTSTSTSNKDVGAEPSTPRWSLFADGLFAAERLAQLQVRLVYEKLKSDDVDHRNGGFSYYDDSVRTATPLDDYFADPLVRLYSSSTAAASGTSTRRWTGSTFTRRTRGRSAGSPSITASATPGTPVDFKDRFGADLGDVYDVEHVGAAPRCSSGI